MRKDKARWVMFSGSKDYRDYIIQVTEHAGGYQAAIYPEKPGMISVDWEAEPIWSPDINGAYLIAKQRINAALSP
jgi:hypothetical protein